MIMTKSLLRFKIAPPTFQFQDGYVLPLNFELDNSKFKGDVITTIQTLDYT